MILRIESDPIRNVGPFQLFCFNFRFTGHQQRLKRGMSNTMNNAHIVSIAHDLVLNGIKETGASVSGSGASTTTNCQKDEVMDTLSCTFILPDINHYPPEFRAFLHKDLIETSTLISLEQAGQSPIPSSLCRRYGI